MMKIARVIEFSVLAIIAIVIIMALASLRASAQQVARLDFGALVDRRQQVPQWEATCPQPMVPLSFGVSTDYTKTPPQLIAWGCINEQTGQVQFPGAAPTDLHFFNYLAGGGTFPPIGSPLGYNFWAAPFNLFLQPQSAPAAPALAVFGGSGTTTYGYSVSELGGPDSNTPLSAATTISAPASLSSGVFIEITATCIANKDSVAFNRTQGGSGTGLIGIAACNPATGTAVLDDTGQGSSGSTPIDPTGITTPFLRLGQSPALAGGQWNFPYWSQGGLIEFAGIGTGGFNNAILQNGFGASSLDRIGLNFSGNQITVAQLNGDGSISGSILEDWTFPTGPIFPSGIGLGNGGGAPAPTQSSIFLWDRAITTLGGSNIDGLFVSNESVGGSLPNTVPGYLHAQFYDPTINGSAAPAMGLTNSAILTCSAATNATDDCNPAGMYTVNVYAEDTTSPNCTTPGSAGIFFTVSYTDDTQAQAVQIPLQTTAGTTETHMPLGTKGDMASGTFNLWTKGAVPIILEVTTTQCTTGLASVKVYAEVRRLN